MLQSSCEKERRCSSQICHCGFRPLQGAQQHQHRPLQHLAPFGPGTGICPPPGPFPFDLERKLDLQHVEIQKLAIENQKLANSYHSSRRELAPAQHELQIIQAHTDAARGDVRDNLRRKKRRGVLQA